MQNKLKTIFSRIAETEIWLVAFVVAISILKPEFLPIALVIALLYWGIRWIAYGKPSRRTPVDIGIALLVLMIPVSLWATALPQTTRTQIYRLFLGILFFYSIVNWTRTSKRLSLIIVGTLLLGLVLAGGALISVKWATTKLPFIPAELYQRFTLLVSDTVNPNVLAGSIILVLPVAISLLLFAWKGQSWGMRILATISLAACSGILLLTQSRSAIIALVLAAGLLIILRWRWGWVLVASAASLVLILYQSALFPGLSRTNGNAVASIESLGLEGRIEIWSRAIYAIQDFAFTGIGMGSFTEVIDLLYPLFLSSPGKVSHAHNLFLQVAVDLGIPGLIAWLSILIGVTLTAWQLYRHGKRLDDSWAAALGAGFLGSQLALVMHGFTDAVTWGMVRSAPFVWAIWGGTIAAWSVIQITKGPKSNTARTA